MLLVFERLGLLESAEVDELLLDCDEESRKITIFSSQAVTPVWPLCPYPFPLTAAIACLKSSGNGASKFFHSPVRG